MQTLRLALLALVLLALAPLTAHAQLIAGSSVFFDHTPAEQASVERYQLCVDAVSETACQDIGVTRVGTTDTLTATVPVWVPRGRRELTVRAVWKSPLTGASAPSNVLGVVVVGGPERLRTTEGAQ